MASQRAMPAQDGRLPVGDAVQPREMEREGGCWGINGKREKWWTINPKSF